jgi:hypothetical protein
MLKNSLVFNGFYVQIDDILYEPNQKKIYAISFIGSREAVTAIKAGFSLKKRFEIYIGEARHQDYEGMYLKPFQKKIPDSHLFHCVMICPWFLDERWDFLITPKSKTDIDALWEHFKKHSKVPVLDHWKPQICEHFLEFTKLEAIGQQWHGWVLSHESWQTIYQFIIKQVKEKVFTEHEVRYEA